MPKRIDEEKQRQIIELYRQRPSLRKVGQELGISYETVRCVLIRNDEPRRIVGGPEKYPKTDFSGDPAEQTRLVGFVVGDCSVSNHGKQIQVQAGSTHPAQLKLFDGHFERHGHVGTTPFYNKLHSLYEWQRTIILNDSFEFLIEYKENPMKFLCKIAENGYEHFYNGSLTDTEGWVGIGIDRGKARVVLSISNNNKQLLEFTKRTLGGHVSRIGTGYQLRLYRQEAVEAIRKLPIMHDEKAASKELILRHYDNGDIGLQALREYRELRHRIDEEVRLCTLQARVEWIRRHGRPHKDDPDQTIPPD